MVFIGVFWLFVFALAICICYDSIIPRKFKTVEKTDIEKRIDNLTAVFEYHGIQMLYKDVSYQVLYFGLDMRGKVFTTYYGKNQYFFNPLEAKTIEDAVHIIKNEIGPFHGPSFFCDGFSGFEEGKHKGDIW